MGPVALLGDLAATGNYGQHQSHLGGETDGCEGRGPQGIPWGLGLQLLSHSQLYSLGSAVKENKV
ncbi:hypothetical protein U9M48_017102 [Paspalum notatum var. saurae]|uniref:Uncharacterized protein n=1 Tax=Paspalum notatum var. saurae TaxID=547442 RepID=A0AAQ3WNY7_PASNO